MTQTKELTIETTEVRDATKDAGRVRMGAGMIRFADAPVAPEATKDAGRVKIGAGMLRF